MKYLTVYGLWIVDLVLGLWLVIISRSAFLRILAQFYKPGDLRYGHVVGFYDKIFSIIIGLGWLAFSIFTEAYFRAGALEPGLLKRFAKVTGPIFLCMFIVDMIILWTEGIGNSVLRWLLLVLELGVGVALIVFVNPRPTSKPT